MIQISNAETHAVYIRTRAHTITIYAGAYNTPMSIYYYLFSKYMVVEVSQVSTVKNKRLVNALNMSAIPPSHIYTDTQAWDCYAKKLLATPLRLQRYEKKLDCTNLRAGFCKINVFCMRNSQK